MFQFLTTKYGVGQSESELDKLIGFLPFLPTRILSVFWPHNTELEQRVFFSLILQSIGRLIDKLESRVCMSTHFPS